jgi:hypothetical protein
MSGDLILSRPADRRSLLIPATPHDMDMLIEMVAPGRDVRAKLTQPRSLPQHRFYWGLLQKVVQNHEFYSTTQALHVWLKIKQGLVDAIELHDGHTHIRVGSTSFENMDGIKFKQYLNTSIDLIVTDVLPGVRRSELLRATEDMIGMRFSDLRVGTLQ